MMKEKKNCRKRFLRLIERRGERVGEIDGAGFIYYHNDDHDSIVKTHIISSLHIEL